MLRVAFPLIGRGGWTGGINYLKNTLSIINSRLPSEIEPWLFLSAEEDKTFGAELRPMVQNRAIVDPAIEVAGRGLSLARAIATGRDAVLQKLLAARSIDVVFETASFYGDRFSIPVLSWMPDFQHRLMPEMFGHLGWWRRDLGYQMQIRSSRTLMVSSAASRSDLERFYPSSIGRAYIVRFAINIDPEPHLKRREEIRNRYDLPDRYFFLPNQFWQHKNHSVIVEALALIKATKGLDRLPPVILTGQPKDPRNPTYFSDLMARVETLGLASHLRYLGLVPFEDVLALNANCDAMINPSRLEGWSTPIEEAKVFATPVILSDIPIHREQAPNARFFDWRSAESAAEALREVAARPQDARPKIDMLRVKQNRRLDEYAQTLLAAVRAAAAAQTRR